MNHKLILLLWAVLFSACSLADDPDVLRRKLEDSRDDSETQSSSSDTSTDTGTGPHSGTDNDTDTGVDTNTDADTNTTTDADSNTSSDADTDTISDAETDSDTETDSGTGTDLSTDTTTDTDSDNDTGTDSADSDSTGQCTADFDCMNKWCDTEAAECKECIEDFACGPNCINCALLNDTPICAADGTQCVGCNGDTDCADGDYCTAQWRCESCNTNDHCGSQCVTCGAGDFTAQPFCSDTGECVGCRSTLDCESGNYCDDQNVCQPCNTDDHCGSECAACGVDDFAGVPRCDGTTCVMCLENNDCPTATPSCDTDANTCHECVSNNDCRESWAVTPSALGICTPDRTCTCWAPDTDLTSSCISNANCPEGYSCAQDIIGAVHYSCLRNCSTTSYPQDGIACEQRNTSTDVASVWTPTTTCYAFEQQGKDCSENGNLCSVDGVGGLSDGTCVDASNCSFPCWDNSGTSYDTWCPTKSTGCNSSITSPYCL